MFFVGAVPFSFCAGSKKEEGLIVLRSVAVLEEQQSFLPAGSSIPTRRASLPPKLAQSTACLCGQCPSQNVDTYMGSSYVYGTTVHNLLTFPY